MARNYSSQIEEDSDTRDHQVPYPTQAYVDHAYEKLSREETGAIRSQRSLFQGPRSTSGIKISLIRPGDKRMDRVSLVNQKPEQHSERVVLQPATNIKIIQTSKSFRTSDSLAERNSALELKKFQIRLNNPGQLGSGSAQVQAHFVPVGSSAQHANNSMRAEHFR